MDNWWPYQYKDVVLLGNTVLKIRHSIYHVNQFSWKRVHKFVWSDDPISNFNMMIGLKEEMQWGHR